MLHGNNMTALADQAIELLREIAAHVDNSPWGWRGTAPMPRPMVSDADADMVEWLQRLKRLLNHPAASPSWVRPTEDRVTTATKCPRCDVHVVLSDDTMVVGDRVWHSTCRVRELQGQADGLRAYIANAWAAAGNDRAAGETLAELIARRLSRRAAAQQRNVIVGPDTHAALCQVATDLEQSATGMIGCSKNDVMTGDLVGAVRRQIIAARESAWAEQMWAALGDPGRAAHCRSIHLEASHGGWFAGPSGEERGKPR